MILDEKGLLGGDAETLASEAKADKALQASAIAEAVKTAMHGFLQ